jgi:hypothetical protein
MRIHDPIAIARNLAAFDFQELAPFNGGAFCMYYGDKGDQSDWELHPDTDVHDVVEMFFTPGTTLECSADDPRVASPETFVPDVTRARSERSRA